MLNKTMWNIFKNTGNINAYLYINDYNEQNLCERDIEMVINEQEIEIKALQ